MEQAEKLLNEPKQNITIQKCTKCINDVEKQIKVEKKNLKKAKKHALSWADSIIAVFIIGPLVVGYWRGTWSLMNIYEQNHPNALPNWGSFFFGVVILITFTILRDAFVEYIKNKNDTIAKRIISQIVRKVYTYSFSIACIMQWHAAWAIGTEYFGGFYDNIVITSLCVILMIVLRCFRNNIAPPFIVVMDHEDVTFTFPTRFRKKSTDKTSLYVLDCSFSVFIVGTLVVFVWRGAWAIVDMFLFPDDFTQSSWVSLILGYTIVAMAFSMQPAMKWLCDRLKGCWRIIVSDIFLFFSVVGTVNVWRGIWNLLDIYFLPDHPEISCWTTHWVCLILLILLNCSNTLLVRGVYIDAEEPGGKCVVFPCYYLRLIFKNERLKKHNKKYQLDILAKRKQELECIKTSCACSTEQNHIILLQHVIDSNHVDS